MSFYKFDYTNFTTTNINMDSLTALIQSNFPTFQYTNNAYGTLADSTFNIELVFSSNLSGADMTNLVNVLASYTYVAPTSGTIQVGDSTITVPFGGNRTLLVNGVSNGVIMTTTLTTTSTTPQIADLSILPKLTGRYILNMNLIYKASATTKPVQFAITKGGNLLSTLGTITIPTPSTSDAQFILNAMDQYTASDLANGSVYNIRYNLALAGSGTPTLTLEGYRSLTAFYM